MDLVYNAAIAVQCDRAHLDPFPKKSLDENELAMIGMKVYEYEMAKIWFLRLQWGWSKQILFPVSIAKAKPYKPLGEVLQAIFKLCVWSFVNKKMVASKIAYSDSTAWFEVVYRELLYCACLWAVTEIEITGKRKKRELLDGWLGELNLLKDFKNPVTTADRMPATQVLFDAAIELAEQDEFFYRDFYRPFLKTVAADIRVRSGKEWGCVRKDELGRPYVLTGRGKERVYFPTLEDVKNCFSAESVAG